MPTRISEKNVTTRKPHMCHCCLRNFNSGSHMRADTNVYDGDIYTLYICVTCQEAIKRHDFSDTDGVSYEGCCVNDCDDKAAWDIVRIEKEGK